MKKEDIKKLIFDNCQWVDTVNEDGIGELQKYSFEYEERYTNLKGVSFYIKHKFYEYDINEDCDVYFQYENSELELCETLEDVKKYIYDSIFWYIDDAKEHMTMVEELRYICNNII